jgi:uncharacterized protein (UPF0332 family)
MNYKEKVEDFLNRGLIKKQEINFIQIEKHILRAYKDLKVAKINLTIDEEVAYNYAYLAMLRCARGLLFLKGFRPSDGQQHKTVIEIVYSILGKNFKDLIEKFDRMRRKRNQFTYDPFLPVSKEEAENALKSAENFLKKVSEFIKKETPQQKFNF